MADGKQLLIGDLPDADARPPENVLFICKMNKVTNSEALELIFSRFGEIRTCNVVCDSRTGLSLQYAFIEFEEQTSCEEAYIKMNNVLIDDRRIKVDVSIQAKERASRNGSTVSYRHSDFYQLITLLMSSIELHLSNKPKQVFFNPINIFDTFTHSITLL